MASVPIGAHIDADDPLGAAADLGADCVQIFLGNPQSWKKPPPREDAEELRASDVGIYVHAPYLINVCSPRPNVRYGSRKILQQTCEAAADVGALAVIVHPGHAEDGIEEGFGRWTRTLEMLESELPVFLENTAGGDNAMTRYLERIKGVWDAISSAEGAEQVGFCLDTCHAHAGGNKMETVVADVLAITGRIDLVHCNDSRDEFDSGADRHANLGHGKVDPDLLAAVVREAGAPVVLETPGGAAEHLDDIAWLREHA